METILNCMTGYLVIKTESRGRTQIKNTEYHGNI